MACKKVDRKASQNDIFATSFTLCKKSLNLFEFILLEKLTETFFLMKCCLNFNDGKLEVEIMESYLI